MSIKNFLALAVTSCSLSMTALSLNRFLMVAQPKLFDKLTYKQVCFASIIIVWLTSIIISFPIIFVRKHLVFTMAEDLSIEFCLEDWKSDELRRVFAGTSFLIIYMAPCILLIYSIGNVWQTLRTNKTSDLTVGKSLKNMKKDAAPKDSIVFFNGNRLDESNHHQKSLKESSGSLLKSIKELNEIKSLRNCKDESRASKESSINRSYEIQCNKDLSKNEIESKYFQKFHLNTFMEISFQNSCNFTSDMRPDFIIAPPPSSTHIIDTKRVKRIRRSRGSIPNKTAESNTSVKSRRQLANILLGMALCFVFCWLPYNLMSLYMDLFPSEDLVNILRYTLVLGHSYSAINPIVYWMINRRVGKLSNSLIACK